jgi:hypothetical protein
MICNEDTDGRIKMSFSMKKEDKIFTSFSNFYISRDYAFTQ